MKKKITALTGAATIAIPYMSIAETVTKYTPVLLPKCLVLSKIIWTVISLIA